MAKIDIVLQKFPDQVYDKEITSNLYKLLSSLTVELDTFMVEMERIKNSRFIDFAVGQDLDKIAAILNTLRFSNESDASFRGRLKARVPSFVGGGTIISIKQVIQIFLNVEPMIIEHYIPGDGHPIFDDGVLNGMGVSKTSGLTIKVGSGVSYFSGSKITSVDSNITLSSDSTTYLKLKSDGTFIQGVDSTTPNGFILIAKIDTNTASVINITDMRRILNPFEDMITDLASITIQIPYIFWESTITLQDVKNIIKTTRSAGIAVLIDVVGSYEEYMQISEGKVDFSFLVGFSGVGSNNFFGGQW